MAFRDPATLWTAPALDRCILLSFFYPQALLILGWVATGNAGPVEKLIGLVPDYDYLGHRLPTLVAITIAIYAYTRSAGSSGAAKLPLRQRLTSTGSALSCGKAIL